MSDKPITTAHQAIYEALAAPFEHTFRDVRGGVELEYVTGEQVISRLNGVLGLGAWDFAVDQHGINAEADECWALGTLTVYLPGGTATVTSPGGAETTVVIEPRVSRRQQFGSQKIKRSRSSGTPIDIGFDLKGAATDALKKAASLYGVGLYLMRKEASAQDAASGPPAARTAPQAPQTAQRPSQPQNRASGPPAGSQGQVRQPAPPPPPKTDVFTCAECGKELGETRFRDGTVWPPAQLADYGRRKYNRALCMEHYRAANDAATRAQRQLEDVPF